jgi:rubrerythrin
MYPGFEKTAREENQEMAVMEFKDQILESKEHAEFFQKNLDKISKIFSGLAKVEKSHAEGYQLALKNV